MSFASGTISRGPPHLRTERFHSNEPGAASNRLSSHSENRFFGLPQVPVPRASASIPKTARAGGPRDEGIVNEFARGRRTQCTHRRPNKPGILDEGPVTARGSHSPVQARQVIRNASAI